MTSDFKSAVKSAVWRRKSIQEKWEIQDNGILKAQLQISYTIVERKMNDFLNISEVFS